MHTFHLLKFLQVGDENDCTIADVERKSKEEIAAVRKAKSKQVAELHRKLRDQGARLAEAEEERTALQMVFASQLEAVESQISKSKGEAQSLQMRYTHQTHL